MADLMLEPTRRETLADWHGFLRGIGFGLLISAPTWLVIGIGAWLLSR